MVHISDFAIRTYAASCIMWGGTIAAINMRNWFKVEEQRGMSSNIGTAIWVVMKGGVYGATMPITLPMVVVQCHKGHGAHHFDPTAQRGRD
jgi:hypothetical protein